MVSTKQLPPLIKRSLDRLMELGEASWTDFASWTIPGKNKPLRQHTVNVVRHLKRAGYIEDVSRLKRNTGAIYSIYRLTPLGIRAAISGNRERG